VPTDGDKRVKANQKRRSQSARQAERRRAADRPAGQAAGGVTLAASTIPAEERVATPMPKSARGRGATVAEAPAPAQRGLAGWWARARTDVTLAALFVVAALALYLPRIEVPNDYIYDEVYHAYTASQYAIGNTDAWLWSSTKDRIAPELRNRVAYEWTHPPLGKLIITVGILIFGDNTVGWRFMSAIFGALGVAAVYWLALRLTGKRIVAVLASILILVDGLYFVESRSGVLDIFGAVFMTCAFIAFYAYLTAPPERVRTPLLLLGLFLGLGIANKWNAVYATALIGLVVAWRAYLLLPLLWRKVAAVAAAAGIVGALLALDQARSRTGLVLLLPILAVVAWQLYLLFAGATRPDAPQGLNAGLIQHLVWVPLGLAILPLGVYLLSYLPFFLAGFGFSELRELHRQMLWYHSNLKATHAYQSTWYQWPLAYRPVWYSVTYGDGVLANTYANGNPLLYWAFLPAVAYVTIRWWTDRHPALPIMLIGFFGQWLPWALIPRIAYIYHFLPAAIFGTVAVAIALGDMWDWGKKEIGWRGLAVAYVSAVVLAFAFFYPIYSSVNLTKAQLDSRIWFENWR
jgi:dolichyl-phosphate-mannose-protein mannosyltransferase